MQIAFLYFLYRFLAHISISSCAKFTIREEFLSINLSNPQFLSGNEDLMNCLYLQVAIPVNTFTNFL